MYAAADADSESDSDSSCLVSLLWPDHETDAVLHTVLPLERPGVTNAMVIQYDTAQHNTTRRSTMM